MILEEVGRLATITVTWAIGNDRATRLPVILQIELAYLLQEGAISTLPFQVIHLLSGHGALVGDV